MSTAPSLPQRDTQVSKISKKASIAARSAKKATCFRRMQRERRRSVCA